MSLRLKSKRNWRRLDLTSNNWQIGKIGELCENIFSGGTPNTRNKDFWGGDLGWLSSGETRNRFVETTKKTITKQGAEKSSTRLAFKGDVVMASAGQGYTRGQVSFLNINTYINQSVISMRTNEKKLNNLFLFYNLSNRYEELRALSDSNSIRGSITTKLIKSMDINYPNLVTQEKIVGILSALDYRIEENKKINHHLEQIAMAIFDDIFPDVSSGNNTIGEYIVPKRGKGLLSKDVIDGVVPVVAGGLRPAAYHNAANTVAPVITISASGANAGYVNLWSVPVWSSDSSFIDKSMTNDVYFWYIMLKKRQQEIFDSQTGSAQPHIYPKHIDIMPTIALSDELIAGFTEKVTPMFEQIGNNLNEIKVLQDSRDALLPKLMSGELSVID